MKLKKNTYRTLSGVKEIIEIENKKSSEWLVYRDNKPAFYVDLYDLATESNAMMNSLVLCAKRSMEDTLELINKKNNINLQIRKPSKIGLQMITKSENVELELEHLPEEWLDYSL